MANRFIEEAKFYEPLLELEINPANLTIDQLLEKREDLLSSISYLNRVIQRRNVTIQVFMALIMLSTAIYAFYDGENYDEYKLEVDANTDFETLNDLQKNLTILDNELNPLREKYNQQQIIYDSLKKDIDTTKYLLFGCSTKPPKEFKYIWAEHASCSLAFDEINCKIQETHVPGGCDQYGADLQEVADSFLCEHFYISAICNEVAPLLHNLTRAIEPLQMQRDRLVANISALEPDYLSYFTSFPLYCALLFAGELSPAFIIAITLLTNIFSDRFNPIAWFTLSDEESTKIAETAATYKIPDANLSTPRFYFKTCSISSYA